MGDQNQNLSQVLIQKLPTPSPSKNRRPKKLYTIVVLIVVLVGFGIWLTIKFMPVTLSASYTIWNGTVYYNKIELTSAHADTFTYLGGENYAKDDTSVYWGVGHIIGADVETFRYVGYSYAKDKNHVYDSGKDNGGQSITCSTHNLGGCRPFPLQYTFVDGKVYYNRGNGPREIVGVDLNTFEYIDQDNPRNKYFTKDQYHVYHWDEQLVDVDPKTFSITNEYYTKDKNHVYWGSVKTPIPEADPATFKSMGDSYAKDAYHVWYQNTIMPGVDSITFRVIGNVFAADKNNVYRSNDVFYGADPDSFMLLNNATGYEKDKNHVYCSTLIVEGADPDTLQTIGAGYAIDAHNAYACHKVISGVDIKSLVYVGGGYAKDKNHVYYSTKSKSSAFIVVGADPDTIEYVTKSEYVDDMGSFAKDKSHIYQGGVLVPGVLPTNCTTTSSKLKGCERK